MSWMEMLTQLWTDFWRRTKVELGESRSQTCLDYAESWQRKTKSAPWVCLPPRGAPWRGKSVRTQAFRIHAFALAGRTSSLHHTQGDALGYVLVAPSLHLDACSPLGTILFYLRNMSNITDCDTKLSSWLFQHEHAPINWFILLLAISER